MRTLETIRTLIESGKLEAASEVIDEALKTETLETVDPRVQRLSAQLKDAESRKAGESTSIPTLIPASFETEHASTPGPAVPVVPPPSENTFLRLASTAQGAAAQPALAPQSVAPNVAPETPSELSASVGAQAARPVAVAGEPTEQEVVSSGVPATARPVETQAASSTGAAPVKERAAETRAAETLWSRHRAAILAILALGLIGAVWAGTYAVRSRLAQTAAKTTPQPARPKINPIEVRQREVLNAAGPLIAANDLDGARKQLQEAAAWNGPLTPEIQKRISGIDESANDANLRQLRRREEVMWQQALKRVTEGKYIEARTGLRQILTLRAGGVHREDAQTYLDKVIPQKIQENELLAQAHLEMSQGEFQSARFISEQLKQNGGDPAPLVSKIDEAERNRLVQLEDQFNQLKQRDDDAAVQKLKALLQKFQALSNDGGPQSNEALSYANGIPGAIVDVQNRMQAKSAAKPAVAPESASVIASKAAVRAVIQRYVQAFEQRNADSLTKIWPTIGANYTSYKSAFEAASSIRMQLNIRTLDVSTDGATAIVEARVSQDYTSKDAPETKNSKHAVTFELDKVDGAWIITDIQQTELPGN